MRLSRYFLPLLKETPSDATVASHRYMLRAGMIRQNSAGIYTWLPLGSTTFSGSFAMNVVHVLASCAGANF